MTCKHKNTELQTLTRYDGSEGYPPKLRPKQFKICLECKENLGEYPPRIGAILFKGKGTNDKRRMKGDFIGE